MRRLAKLLASVVAAGVFAHAATAQSPPSPPPTAEQVLAGRNTIGGVYVFDANDVSRIFDTVQRFHAFAQTFSKTDIIAVSFGNGDACSKIASWTMLEAALRMDLRGKRFVIVELPVGDEAAKIFRTYMEVLQKQYPISYVPDSIAKPVVPFTLLMSGSRVVPISPLQFDVPGEKTEKRLFEAWQIWQLRVIRDTAAVSIEPELNKGNALFDAAIKHFNENARDCGRVNIERLERELKELKQSREELEWATGVIGDRIEKMERK